MQFKLTYNTQYAEIMTLFLCQMKKKKKEEKKTDLLEGLSSQAPSVTFTLQITQ
jgi:hypothetical protein